MSKTERKLGQHRDNTAVLHRLLLVAALRGVLQGVLYDHGNDDVHDGLVAVRSLHRAGPERDGERARERQ